MMVSRNKILLLGLLIISSLSLSAQSVEEIESRMNEIKLNDTMVYGEGLNGDKNLAYGNALNDLLQTVNELREERNQEPVIGSTLQPIAKELSYSANGRHTILLYIPISQVYGLKVSNHSDVTGQSSTQAPPTPPAPPFEQPAPQAAPQPAPQPVQTTPQPQISDSISEDIIEVLCGQDNWMEIKGFLMEYKGLGEIKETGMARNPSEVPADAISILVDEMYGILAILSPKNSAQRINYRTNNTDSETNYSNCKVIVWYR